MKQFFNALVLLTFVAVPSLAFASESITTRIQSVLLAEKPGQAVQILSTIDGRVYDLAPSVDLMKSVQLAAERGTPLNLFLADDLVVDAKNLTADEIKNYQDDLQASSETPATEEFYNESKAFLQPVIHSPELGYQASNLSARSDADSLFAGLRDLDSKSQCYQRAHYWARQMWSKGIYSSKIFLFFTSKFVREHKYRWWFHVAPYVYVQGEEIVLDPEFVRHTMVVPEWTDTYMMDTRFVRNPLSVRPDCREVPTYSAYRDHQEESVCYTLKLPMYYYQPRDAELLEKQNVRLEGWREFDVDHAKKAEDCGVFGRRCR
jgi:polyhydroxyalkanoate synthesis regulator phasin